MTLHEAIVKILQEAGNPLSASDIANRINEAKLYTRKDGNPVPVNQIHARVKNYPAIFYQEKGLISLHQLTENKNNLTAKLNEEIIKTFFNQVYTIEKNTDLRNDLSKFTNYLLLKDIPNKINLSDITNLLNEEDLVSIRKNLILKIRQEIKKRGRDTIGYLSNEGLRIAVAASAIYEEQYGLPGKLRNAIAHGSGPENVVDFLKNEDLKNLPPELINLIVIYLSTYKVFKGKDLVQFYLDLIEDWGLVWNVATPLWISKLMARLASPKVNDKVWDPAAGTGRTLLEILEVNPFADIYGCEINPDAYKLARAVLSLEKVVSSGILNCDALNSGTGPYEIVISDPPKGKIQYKNAKGTLNTDPDGALTFLKQMVSRTIEGGTIVALITDSSLLRRFRLQILPEVWIKAIISLPTASFGSYTSATHSLILLNKKKIDDKEEPFPARFLDSEEIIKQIKIDLPGIDEAETYQELNDRIEDLVNVKSLSSSRIGKDVFHNDLYSIDVFTVNYHLSDSWDTIKTLEEKGERLLSLSDVLTEPKTSRYSKELLSEEIYIIQPKDLYSNSPIQDLIYNPKNTAYNDPETMIRGLEESAILVNRRVDYFAPTFVEIKEKKAGINLNIFAFGWNVNLVIPEYVVYQLKSVLVKQQLEAMAVGTTYRYVQKKDILNIKIPVPSLSEQYEILSKSEKDKTERSEIVKFISQIQLVETREQLKKELERYVQENHFHNGNPRFQTEMDFKVFPFTPDEIQKNTWFKLSDDKHFAYILLLSDKQVLGVLILENVDRINFEVYSEINTYAEFLFKLTRHILSSTASSNLAKFAHTTKNFLLNLHEPLKAIANTQNQELKDLLSRHYIDTEEAIDLMIKGGEGKKEDFLAINVLQDALKRISLYTSFFKKISEIYHQIVEDNLERINIIDIIRAADTDKAVQILDDKQSVFVYGKHKSILLAFTDLIQNACKYSPDRKCKIQVVEEIYHVEIIISNKVKEHCMMDKEFYENLGKDWVTRDSGTGTGSGFFSARQSIEDSNGELHKAPFEEYVMNKEFKIVIKLKTN